jgi:nucleotide-binding universal stress UspA family protein
MQDNTLKQRRAVSSEKPVRILDGRAQVTSPEGDLDLPITSLPEKFVDWIEQGRRSMYGKLLGKAAPGFFTSHLPVVTTLTAGSGFPFNCSNKGVGFLPKPEYLEHFTDLFRRTLENTRGRPWQESMRERIAAVSSFYFDRDKIDYRALSTLEIFEKGTYRNLSRTPLAAVHYTGNAPEYISFQVNCAVEIIRPDDPRHAFVHLARIMFEYDSFHISQTNFPYAYVLWISEVLDKTPFRVPEKGNVVTLARKGDMAWDADAVESINRAPGMIRQFITESIEKYARDRGYDRISMALVREAREVLERTPPHTEDAPAEPAQAWVPGTPAVTATAAPAPVEEPPGKASAPSGKDDLTASKPYASVYVGLDSSPLSDAATTLAIAIGKRVGAALTGSHVYAAKMHDNRFRAMEGGLPEEFQKEKELNRQRKIHDTLITKGLELITDSYLEAMARECAKAEVGFTAVSLEGRNWKALAEDIDIHDHDLVVIGAHGIGRVGHSQLGSVAERLLRRVRRDLLLVRVPEEKNLSDEIMVGLDGSARSWGALRRALQLAKAFGKRVTAVSAFDPYFHYAMFKSLNRTLTEKARKVFKFEEQEKLHEDIIDSGLAKIYQSYLNIAKRMAEEEGAEIGIELLDGKPFEKILQRTRKAPPWLLMVGRIGFHSDEDMDVGGNTENLCRLAACNVLVVDSKAKPPTEFQAEETVAWTQEARARLGRIPAMAQGMAMKAIQNYCIAEGYTVVTETILNEAVKSLLPPEALKRMGLGEEAPAAAGPEGAHDRIALSFKCQACGHVHHGSRPHQCPICGMGGGL